MVIDRDPGVIAFSHYLLLLVLSTKTKYSILFEHLHTAQQSGTGKGEESQLNSSVLSKHLHTEGKARVPADFDLPFCLFEPAVMLKPQPTRLTLKQDDLKELEEARAKWIAQKEQVYTLLVSYISPPRTFRSYRLTYSCIPLMI